MTDIQENAVTGTEAGNNTHRMARIALGFSILSLVLSGWTAYQVQEDNDVERQVENRLACLELPGPNDCGADGR
jgi:hypothetical protein